MAASSSSSLPSSPLPLSYSCSQFHNPLYHSLDIWQLVTSCRSSPPSDLQCCPSWSTLPAEPCFFLPAPATASSWHHQLLQRVQANKPSQRAPKCNVCADLLCYWGFLSLWGTKGTMTIHHRLQLLGQTNLRRNIIFNQLEILVPKYIVETSQVKQAPRVKATPSRISSWPTATSARMEPAENWHSHISCYPPAQGQEAKLHAAFLLFIRTILGCWEKALFTTSSNSPWRDNVSSGRNEIGSNL